MQTSGGRTSRTRWVALAAGMLAAALAQAGVPYRWAAAADGAWCDGSNWIGGVAPSAGGDVVFDSASAANCAASATDANDVRFCYGGDLKQCLPPQFFTNKCRNGQSCTGGMCATTGVCNLLCRHSAECASGCCSWDRTTDAKNPSCADDPAGKTCLP